MRKVDKIVKYLQNYDNLFKMWQNWRLLTENASLFRYKNCLCWKVQAADPHKLAQTSKLRFLGVFSLWWWTKSHLGWTHGLNIIFCVFRVFYPNLMHNTRRKQANQKFVYFSQNRFCDQEWSLKLEISTFWWLERAVVTARTLFEKIGKSVSGCCGLPKMKKKHKHHKK